MIDRRAIDQLGIPGFELMTRAGAAAFAMLRRRWPAARRLRVVCGAGNNGGDGYLVARDALASGLSVDLVALDTPRAGDAARAREAFEALGGIVHPLTDWSALPPADVIVDAIYGTGLNCAPAGEAASAIEAINASGLPVLALDVPSRSVGGYRRMPGRRRPCRRHRELHRAQARPAYLSRGGGWRGGTVRPRLAAQHPRGAGRAPARTGRVTPTSTRLAQGWERPRARYRWRPWHGRRRAHGRGGGVTYRCRPRQRGYIAKKTCRR